MTIAIAPFEESYRRQIVQLSIRAWAPVFSELKGSVASYVYDAFYPDGWATRQAAEIEGFLSKEGEHVWVAVEGAVVLGWIGIRLHPASSMGEIYIVATDPARQREGIATRLIETASIHMRAAHMKIVMVETGDDPGHAQSRATYESIGFERWPVARYFRQL